MFEDMIAVLEVNLAALVRTQYSDFLPCGNEKSLSVIARYRIIKYFLSVLDDEFVYLPLQCVIWFSVVLLVDRFAFTFFSYHALVVLRGRDHRIKEWLSLEGTSQVILSNNPA